MLMVQYYFFSKKHINKLFSLEANLFPLEYAFSLHFSGNSIFLKCLIWKNICYNCSGRQNNSKLHNMSFVINILHILAPTDPNTDGTFAE